MGLRKIIVSLVGAVGLLFTAACNTATPSIPGLGYEKGVNVQSYSDACRAITAEEISALTGTKVRVLEQGPWEDVIRDLNTGQALTPDPGVGQACVFTTQPDEDRSQGVIVTFMVQLDPTEEFYNYGAEQRAAGVPTVDRITEVANLGDKGYVNRPDYSGIKGANMYHVSYTAHWGTWNTKAIAVSLDETKIGSEDGLADALRAFISRLPREYQQ